MGGDVAPVGNLSLRMATDLPAFPNTSKAVEGRGCGESKIRHWIELDTGYATIARFRPTEVLSVTVAALIVSADFDQSSSARIHLAAEPARRFNSLLIGAGETNH